MAAYVNLNEYLAYYGLTDAGGDGFRHQADLEMACDVVRDYLHQQVDRVTNDVEIIQGTGTRALLLPELPVVSVASVVMIVEDADDEVITDYTLDDYGLLWRTYPTSTVANAAAVWAKGYQYQVTYTHGYLPTEVPAILKVVAFQLAHRSPSVGLRQESIADYSATYATDGERTLLSALDRRVVKRVPTP